MKDFLHSVKFKVLVMVAVLVLGFMLAATAKEGFASLPSKLLGTVTEPLQKLSSKISGAASDFLSKFIHADDIQKENEALKEQVASLTKQLVDFDKYKHENEQYKEFFKLQEDNEDFVFEPASVIGRDPDDQFFSFTIDKGYLNDIAYKDPVMTPDGLVGYVTEVGPTYAKVTTLLDPSMAVSVIDSRTRDLGLVAGESSLALEGQCKMSYLSKNSGVSTGDIVVTSGQSGLFPKELVVGRIVDVQTESHGGSLYAVIDPAADIKEVKDVFVIKSFKGQGSQMQEAGKTDSSGDSSENVSSGS